MPVKEKVQKVTSEPAPTPAPPPKPELPAPQHIPVPAVESLVEAQTRLMEHNSAAIRQLGEELKAIALSRNPVPWKLKLNRNKKGFIEDLDLIPRPGG
jgi:hypothetical protein